MKDKITGDLIKDTPESRKALIYGDAYIVKYYDDKQTKKERFAVGVWGFGDFDYRFMKIRQPPKMQMVMGWCPVKGIE